MRSRRTGFFFAPIDLQSAHTGILRLTERAGLILALVRRDYAVQFAGTALGILWVLAQYFFQIAVFFLIFGLILPATPAAPEAVGETAGRIAARMAGARVDYLSYLLGGMCLWLPLSEMLLRSCSILADNRGLIRRTGLGLRGFLWVPVFEGVLHYALIFGLVCLIGLARGVLSPLAPLAFLWGVVTILALSGWAFIFARISILLKDVSPLMRLVFQVLFWLTPIVYVAGPKLLAYFACNPLHAPLELHRRFLFAGEASGFAPGFADWSVALETAGASLAAPFMWIGVIWFVALSLPAYLLSARRLNALVVDQL
jgi:lipopolysaccharide transport system permease protein